MNFLFRLRIIETLTYYVLIDTLDLVWIKWHLKHDKEVNDIDMIIYSMDLIRYYERVHYGIL